MASPSGLERASTNLFGGFTVQEQIITTSLNELCHTTPDVEAVAIISTDGLLLASAMPEHLDGDRVSAMGAALLSLGERASVELERGELEQVIVKGKEGYVLLLAAGENNVLVVIAKKSAKLGLIVLEAKRSVERVLSALP